MSRYPEGTHAGDPNAPWNQPPDPDCGDCENTIATPDDHTAGCTNKGMGPSELYAQREEDAKIEKAERRMDEQRLQKALDQ